MRRMKKTKTRTRRRDGGNGGAPEVCYQQLSLLKAERYPATHCACRLHQVHGVLILPQQRNITLSQQVAYVDKRIHVTRSKTGSRDRLSEENIQVGIRLPCRSVEHVNRR